MDERTKNAQGVTIYIISDLQALPQIMYLNQTPDKVMDCLQKLHEEEIGSELSFLSHHSVIKIVSPVSDHLFIWDKCGFKKVAVSNIMFLEASRSYCHIHLTEGKNILVSSPMAETLKHLSENDFIRIHRGFVANLRYIEALCGNTITMEDGSKLPVGREYRSNVYKSFTFVGTKNRKYIE